MVNHHSGLSTFVVDMLQSVNIGYDTVYHVFYIFTYFRTSKSVTVAVSGLLLNFCNNNGWTPGPETPQWPVFSLLR